MTDQQTSSALLPPLTIETLVNGGAGLARLEGRVVFVPHAAVGDVVSTRVVRSKKDFLEAQIVEILSPSQERCLPPCSVAGDCGGCQWQHLPYARQLYWKEKLFRDTLIHQCRIDPALFLPIIPSPDPWYYRSRVQIKCFNTPSGFITGYYRSHSRYVVAVDRCLIMDQGFEPLLEVLRITIDGTKFAGDIPQIDLFIDDNGKRAAMIHYLGHDRQGLAELLGSLALPADLLLQYRNIKNRSLIKGNGMLQLHVDDPQLLLHYRAGSFTQVNLRQNRQLVQAVINAQPWRESDRVLELYCGMGNFSLSLAKRVHSLVGVEESSQSIAMARINAADNGIENTRFHSSSVEAFLARMDVAEKFDILMLDPPRTGAYSVIKQLLYLNIRKLVYVSCDPQTLARDLKPLLHGGYRFVNSQPVDMFPQTYHCESVTVLEKNND